MTAPMLENTLAGVTGRKKFIYDLWGDAVNTASRMESHGSAGQIQIGKATRDLLTQTGEFDLEPRGRVMIKGKGELETWYLTGLRANGHRAQPEA